MNKQFLVCDSYMIYVHGFWHFWGLGTDAGAFALRPYVEPARMLLHCVLSMTCHRSQANHTAEQRSDRQL